MSSTAFPSDNGAEMCALASLALSHFDNKKLFAEIRSLLHKDMFFSADHQIIFEVVCAMADTDQPIDMVTLRAALDQRQLLEEIGDTQYLAQILNSVPTWCHGKRYASIVREKYNRRRLIETGHSIIRKAYGPSDEDNAGAIALKFAADLTDIGSSSHVHRAETAAELVAKFSESYDSADVRLIKTDLTKLDEEIGGLRKGRLVIVGGRAGMGKSQLEKQILLNIAKRGVKVGLVAIEEDDEKITANLLSNLSGVENRTIINRVASPAEKQRIAQAAQQLAELPLHVVDTAFNLSDITAQVHRLALEDGCEVIGVDHLHLIDGQDAKGKDNRNQEVSAISRSLKMMFRKLNVASVVAAQLNRGGDGGQAYNRKPVLRDLRDSGTLEQDGDLILLLHREDYYRYAEKGYQPTRQLECIIAKNKDGSPGIVPLHFDGAHQRVLDWQGEMPPPRDEPEDPVDVFNR